MRKGVKGVEGGTVELRRQERAVHAGLGGAEQHIPISEEPPLNIKTQILPGPCSALVKGSKKPAVPLRNRR